MGSLAVFIHYHDRSDACHLLSVPDPSGEQEEEKLNEMRSNLKVGDDIVTIGGMMGKVVHVTDDSVTFETSEDQVRIQVAKWAISTNARAEAQAAKEAQDRKAAKQKAKEAKKEEPKHEEPKGPEV